MAAHATRDSARGDGEVCRDRAWLHCHAVGVASGGGGMKRTWILTAIGRDRPGIVANVTKVLYGLGGNLEDSAMTRLAGEFAIILAFAAPTHVTASRVEQAFAPTATRLRLTIAVNPVTVSGRRPAPRRPYLISVYGADHPGIVYRVAELLARSKINITDLSTHRTTGNRPLYHLLLEVELPNRLDPARLERRLKTLGRRLGVTVSLRAAETTVL